MKLKERISVEKTFLNNLEGLVKKLKSKRINYGVFRSEFARYYKRLFPSEEIELSYEKNSVKSPTNKSARNSVLEEEKRLKQVWDFIYFVYIDFKFLW